MSDQESVGTLPDHVIDRYIVSRGFVLGKMKEVDDASFGDHWTLLAEFDSIVISKRTPTEFKQRFTALKISITSAKATISQMLLLDLCLAMGADFWDSDHPDVLAYRERLA